MMKFFTPVILVLAFISLSSFIPEGYRDLYKQDGSVSATVNGQVLQIREKDFYRAMLVNKVNTSAATGTQLSRVATALYFYGLDTVDADGRTFSESLSVEFTYSPSTQNDVPDISVDMSYNYGNYYMLPERNYFTASKIEWSADKTYFVLSGTFNCMMHRRGYTDEMQPAVRVKGEVNNIIVTVPPWIAKKVSTEVSAVEVQN